MVGPDGQTFVNSDGDHGVLRFDAKGTYEAFVGKDLGGGAHGMVLDTNGEAPSLWVAHTGRHEVVQVDLEGKVLRTLSWPKGHEAYDQRGAFNPTAVAVAPGGRVYVADGYGRSWVHEYDAKGEVVHSFGGPGSEPGQFRTPHGITLDERYDPPRLLVSDRENRRLQHFDLDGTFLGVVAKDLRRPCGVSIRGDLVAVAELEGRVTILDKTNAIVGHLGDQPDKALWATNQVDRDRWRPGEFLSPHAVCWDHDGDLYVMDWNRHGRVTRLALRPQTKTEAETGDASGR